MAAEVRQALERLGCRTRAESIAKYHELLVEKGKIRASAPLNAQVDVMFQQLLWTDIRTWGDAHLPSSVPQMHNTTLGGTFLLQIMDAVNIAAISEDRSTDSSSRTAKMRLSDGTADVIGLEHIRMSDLVLRKAPGQKVLLTDPLVRRGMLLLGPSSCRVLGGGIQTAASSEGSASGSPGPSSPPPSATAAPTMNGNGAAERGGPSSAGAMQQAAARAMEDDDDASPHLTAADLAALERMVDEEARPEHAAPEATPVTQSGWSLRDARTVADTPSSVIVEAAVGNIASRLAFSDGAFSVDLLLSDGEDTLQARPTSQFGKFAPQIVQERLGFTPEEMQRRMDKTKSSKPVRAEAKQRVLSFQSWLYEFKGRVELQRPPPHDDGGPRWLITRMEVDESDHRFFRLLAATRRRFPAS